MPDLQDQTLSTSRGVQAPPPPPAGGSLCLPGMSQVLGVVEDLDPPPAPRLVGLVNTDRPMFDLEEYQLIK